MTDKLRLALLQINPVLGHLDGNAERILQARAQAAREGVDLLIGGEMGLLGYPPEDLVLRSSLLEATRLHVEDLALATADGGPALLIGAPWMDEQGRTNAALLLDRGRIAATVRKHQLPNYGVFDEKRVFIPGRLQAPVDFRGVKLGIMVCEDMWFQEPASHLWAAGAEMLVVINASPFENAFVPGGNKYADRLAYATSRLRDTGLPVIYVNQVGGQDEVVFDGGSFAMNPGPEPQVALRLPQWQEDLGLCDVYREAGGWRVSEGVIARDLSLEEEVYKALVTGLRDYVAKNAFPGVIFGLSGGIDSALVAAVSVDALGADRVRAFMLPSPYTSQESLDDAAAVASLLDIRLDMIDITPSMASTDRALSPILGDQPWGLTSENIQSRLRGLLLMAVSNREGPMLVATGNKSEMSVGYATLYGDMCGGYAVLKDVYKTWVFSLSRWRNANRPEGLMGPTGPVMPERVITKAPTAELRDNQRDEDSLPPYDVLDGILQLLVEGECGVVEAAEKGGYDVALVERVSTLLRRAEYKRRQAPPGVKVTRLAFGRDRRYPLTNAFTG